jgi:hypothetical protein
MAKKDEDESDDTFGLPEIEYNPINRGAESTPQNQEESQEQQEEQPVASSPYEESADRSTNEYQESSSQESSEYSSYRVDEEEAPLWPKVLGILLVVAIALSAALYFVWYKPKQDEEKRLLADKQKKEQEAKLQAQRLKEAEEKQRARDQRIADSLASIPKIGVFETLSEPTGRYYVVITSAVDGDLISDQAKKLSKTGVSTKIIPPFGKFKFYRLTIAEGDTYAAAQDIANSKKAELGDALWVLKY